MKKGGKSISSSSPSDADAGWMQRTDPAFGSFIRHVLSETTEFSSGTVQLQKHQLVVRKFLHGSPYRGLLVYHGLGSGKTCAAVAAAEALMSTKKRVVVMLPASLRNNFSVEVKKCSGGGIDESRLHFVSTNGIQSNAIKPKKAEVGGVSLHDSVIVIDEVHNLAGQIRNGGKVGVPLYQAVYNARDAKVVCLSGTIIVNAPFELAVTVNMLSGPARSLVFHKPSAMSDAIEDSLSSNTRVAAYRSEGPRIVVEPVPEGYRRKSARSQLVVRHKSEDPDLTQDPHKSVADDIKRDIGAAYYTRREWPRFPETEEEFDRVFVDDGSLKNASAFQTAAVGTVSHFELTEAEARAKGFPDVLPDQNVVLEMTGTMYERYYEHRISEIEMEDAAARKKKRTGQDDSGAFKSMSRMICNFAFEKKGDRVFKSMTDRGEETDHDAVNENALRKLRANGMAALKGERLAEQSPKMSAIVERLAEGAGPALVYSNFRHMEGVGIFAMVLEAAGYSRLVLEKDEDGSESVSAATDASKPVFYEFRGASETGEGVRVFNGDNSEWNRRRGSGKPPVDVILITQAGAEGISLRGVRQVHIMEPHWNEIRIQQVIGRAARLGSHSHLPREQRTVSVYRYLMKLGGERVEEKRLKRRDKGKTTDQIVAEIALRKARQTETFLLAVKRVAVDCGLYPDSVECGLTSTNAKKRRSVKSAPRGPRPTPPKKVPKKKYSLIEKNGVMYLADQDTGELFSYEAYKSTGKRVPA
nr:DEAD/SNF2-like helicase [Oceanusvirus sp.]